VKLDALGCQKEISAKITAKKAEYVLALKKNYERLIYKGVQMTPPNILTANGSFATV